MSGPAVTPRGAAPPRNFGDLVPPLGPKSPKFASPGTTAGGAAAWSRGGARARGAAQTRAVRFEMSGFAVRGEMIAAPDN